MKRGIFLAVLPMLAWLSIAVAMVLIDPDVRKDEAYVDNHYRSSSDGKAHNNWSYAGNTNPSLDSQGTSEPIRHLDHKSIQGAPESTRRGNSFNYDVLTVYSH
jgi:hypothetical protein